MKKLMMCAIFVLLAGVVLGQNFTLDNITYVVQKDNTAQVTYNGGYYYDYVTIPTTVSYAGNNYIVGSIGEGAFSNSTLLTGVTVPGSVTYIAKKAFYNCKSMTEIKINNSIDSIGNNAFENCTSLKSFSIPFSVATTTIGDNAFYNCNKMTTCSLPNSVISIGSSAFGYCQSLQSFDIPNPIKTIKSSTFIWCNSLLSIVIPDGVKTVGTDAFSNCTSLKNATIPGTVTTLDYGAFYNCTGLQSITLPTSITLYGPQAFWNCTSLNSVRVLNDTPAAITADCFANLPYSATLYVPDGTEKAYKMTPGWSVFFTISGSSTVFTASDGIIYQTLNANEVTVIGYDSRYTFFGNIFIPEKVTHDAVDYNVVKVSANAFSNWSTLSKMDLPKSVVAIEERAFENCPNLSSVVINGAVTTIPKYAFRNCPQLITVTMPNTVITIDDNAFDGCLALNNIALSVALQTVGNSAFSNCQSLTVVHFTPVLKSIGDNAFFQCGNLKDVFVETKNPADITLGVTIFNSVPLKDATLHVPKGTKDAYLKADQWGKFSTIVPKPAPAIFKTVANKQEYDNIVEFDYDAYYKIYPVFDVTTAKEFITSLTLSVEDKTLVYPSLVKEVLYVHGANGTSTVEVINIEGRLICRHQLTNANESISTKGWGKGTYLIRIKSGKGYIQQRIVKQ